MTLPRTVADVLADHVVFEVECIDRMYCNVYVPQLQHTGGLLGYIQRQLGLPIASTAPLGKVTDAFSAAMRRFARDQQVPWVDFAKGQRKDDVMHEHRTRTVERAGHRPAQVRDGDLGCRGCDCLWRCGRRGGRAEAGLGFVPFG